MSGGPHMYLHRRMTEGDRVEHEQPLRALPAAPGDGEG